MVQAPFAPSPKLDRDAATKSVPRVVEEGYVPTGGRIGVLGIKENISVCGHPISIVKSTDSPGFT
jgi:hypothetical protein